MSNKIIVDFDDTLCLHTEEKSNIENGKPNTELIKKLNQLYDLGYYIYIYTARGHISAPDRQIAEYKYRHIIEKWLNDHNVKYHIISFQKPLGIYYIDDKAIRPNELDKLNELIGK